MDPTQSPTPEPTMDPTPSPTKAPKAPKMRLLEDSKSTGAKGGRRLKSVPRRLLLVDDEEDEFVPMKRPY